MIESESALAELRVEFARLAASSATVQERAAEMLRHLGRVVPFDVGWLAVRDPELRKHIPLATLGEAGPLRDYFRLPGADEEVDRLGLNRRRPPMLASEIGPLTEVRAWADYLLPAGFRQGLAAALFTADGRHVGFLSLLSADPSHPSPAERYVVAALSAVIAGGLDRTRDIAETARIVQRAIAGVVLTRAGDVLPLPGLPDDRLLVAGSSTLAVVADELAKSRGCASFLAPTAGAGNQQLVRVTALDVAIPDLDHLRAAVLLHPPGDLHGLTVVDLQVLGLLVEGVPLPNIGRELHVADRAVHSSVRRSRAVLRRSDLTGISVRALRSGTRVPPGIDR